MEFLWSTQYSTLFLSASFLNKLNPISFCEMLCSMFPKRLQQNLPWSVPMIHQVLALLDRDEVPYLQPFWRPVASPSVRRIGRNNHPLSLVRKNGFPCCYHWIPRKILSLLISEVQRVTLCCVWVRLCGRGTSATNRFLPLGIKTWDVVSWWWRDGIAISSPYWSWIFTIWTSITGPITVLPGIAAKTRDWGFPQESVSSRHKWNNLPITVGLVKSSFIHHPGWHTMFKPSVFT